MDSIRIERLRGLSDTGDIKIKPITVLVGQNSSGKSTFLRVFPLLKQSVESRKTGPILWYGRLVDFGSFQNACQNNESSNTIALSFKFYIEGGQSLYDPFYFSTVNYYRPAPYYRRVLDDLYITLKIEIAENSKEETTRTSKLVIEMEDSQIEISFNKNEDVSSFLVNSRDILELGGEYTTQVNTQSLLPFIHEVKDSEDSTLLFKKLKEILHSSTSKRTILQILSRLGLGRSDRMLADMQADRSSLKSWENVVSKWTVESEDFKYLRDILLASSVSSLIEKCSEILLIFSKQVSYIGPVRATAERYYRPQDLAVDTVDHQGRNLAMFLRNLQDSEMSDFVDWTSKHFGFKPSLDSSSSHISLKINPSSSDKKFNIADTGFGFSQILPIIAQLWLLSVQPKHQNSIRISQKVRNKAPVIYAIEQPELHLHPHLQGVLTDAFIASINLAKKKDIDLRLVVETHSETLVNRLGHLVADKKIKPNDISIVLFEPSEVNPGEINVRSVQFNNEGYLTNWPLGFFEMELY